jgi:hypothetical protein
MIATSPLISESEELSYSNHFAFQSITTEQFLAYLKQNLLDKNSTLCSRRICETAVLSLSPRRVTVLPIDHIATEFDIQALADLSPRHYNRQRVVTHIRLR